MESLATTNIWLAILAIVGLLEFLMICAAGFFAYQAYRQVVTVVENVERMHVAPLRARVDAMLDEVQMVVDRVTHVQAAVTDALKHVTGAGSSIAGTVKSKTWPIAGIINGIRVAAQTLKNGKDDEPPYQRYGT
jgi:predicted PurR-regulated permease PerM